MAETPVTPEQRRVHREAFLAARRGGMDIEDAHKAARRVVQLPVVRHECRSLECFRTHYGDLCSQHRTRRVSSPICQLPGGHHRGYTEPCEFTLKIIPRWPRKGASVANAVLGIGAGMFFAALLMLLAGRL